MLSKKMRALGVLLSIAISAGTFAGCSAGKGNSSDAKSNTGETTATSETTESSDQTPATNTDEKVKLTVWYAVSGDSGEKFKAMVEEYDANTENVEIELSYSGKYADTATKVSAALASGTAPDVALMAAGPLYTGGRGDFFIEEKVNSDSDFNKDDVFPGVWEYAKYNGKICAVPYGISTQVLYYNKKILEKAGIDVNNPPKTWDELYEMAKLAQEKGNINNSSDFWGFEVSDVPWLFKSMLNQNENPIIEVDGETVTPVFNDEKSVEVANWWKKMVDEKIMPIGQHDNAENKFLAGNVAFIVASSNRIQRWAGETTVELGAFPMPYFKKQSLALGGNVLVVFGDEGTKKERAWELVKYLSSAEKQTGFALETGYLPIRKSGVEMDIAKKMIEENPMFKIAFEQLDYSWSYWHFDQMGTMDSIISDTVEAIEKNISTPADALNDAVEYLKNEIEG